MKSFLKILEKNSPTFSKFDDIIFSFSEMILFFHVEIREPNFIKYK